MKTLLLLLIFFPIGLLKAASPESMSGGVLRESGTNASHQRFQASLLLHNDGTYSTLFAKVGNAEGLTPPDTYSAPVDGTYTYIKATSESGTLTLSNGDGVNLPPSVSALLNFNTSTSAGNYSGIYQNGFSAAAGGGDFTFTSAASGESPLVNVSTRVTARSGTPAIVGFSVNGTQDVLIRVVGPGLAPFKLTSFWANPSFTLYQAVNGVSTPVPQPTGQPTGWSATNAGAITQQRAWTLTGAFPLATGSADISDVFTLNPGAYTIVIQPNSSADGGDVLIESYLLP